MTSANAPAHGRARGADERNLDHGTGDLKAGLEGGPIQGAGGGPRAHAGGGPIPATEAAAAAGQGTEGRRRNPRKGQRPLQKATAVLEGLAVLHGGTGEAGVRLDHRKEDCPGLHLPGATRKKKRRTKSVRRSETESGGGRGTGTEKKENGPRVRRRSETKSERGNLTARKET